jgi:CheY-like chemotaxis protein
VLIVEDDRDTLAMHALLVRSLGHEPLEAPSGAAALAAIEAHKPEIVITDWGLPDFDGLELCRRLRAGHGRYVYVVILTARTERADLVHALNAGADEFLTKPVDREELSARLSTAERVLGLEETLASRLRALEDSQARLVEAERLAVVGAVGITVRHEVNNPLAAIVGLAELCLIDTKQLPKRVVESLEKIKTLALDIGGKIRRIEEIEAVRLKPYLVSDPSTRMLDIDLPKKQRPAM